MAEASDAERLQAMDGANVDAPGETIAQNASLFLRARRALLASLGAIAITIEESNEFLSRLVERGEVAESDISRIVNEYVGRGGRTEESAEVVRRPAVERTPPVLTNSVEVILERLNVPTHADIEELSRKISLLNEKVTALKQRGGMLHMSGVQLQEAPSQPDVAQVAHKNGDG